MTTEDARMLIDVYIRRIHEATTVARASRNCEDPYNQMDMLHGAQKQFDNYKAMLEQTIARYLESASKEVGLSSTPDVPG